VKDLALQRGEGEEGDGGAWRNFVVAFEAAAARGSGEGSLDDPTAGPHRAAALALRVRRGPAWLR
jgi:hypothetical protein